MATYIGPSEVLLPVTLNPTVPFHFIHSSSYYLKLSTTSLNVYCLYLLLEYKLPESRVLVYFFCYSVWRNNKHIISNQSIIEFMKVLSYRHIIQSCKSVKIGLQLRDLAYGLLHEFSCLKVFTLLCYVDSCICAKLFQSLRPYGP